MSDLILRFQGRNSLQVSIQISVTKSSAKFDRNTMNFNKLLKCFSKYSTFFSLLVVVQRKNGEKKRFLINVKIETREIFQRCAIIKTWRNTNSKNKTQPIFTFKKLCVLNAVLL